MRFVSHRAPVLSRRGMVASSQPLASQAGLAVLMEGGNAADAAVAMAAALAVTEPHSTGIGGDCFILYYDAKTKAVTGLNGSGRAPAGLTIDLLEKEHLVDQQTKKITDIRHPHTISVPGAVAGWMDFLAKHGSMPPAKVLAAGIRLAEEGFPVPPMTSHIWGLSAAAELATARNGKELTMDGRAPRPGEVFKNPGMARALRALAEGGKDGFYKGELARAIVAVARECGSVLSEQDLAEHVSTWDAPISTVYRGHRVWECPPNGHGLSVLLALNILEGFDLKPQDPLGAERFHHMIEAMRIAFADSNWYVADPKFFPVPLKGLLDKAYAAERRKIIDPKRATVDTQKGSPVAGSDTVYFCTVDGAGNACSFINSVYWAFGTGIVPKGWGFSLQNRGFLFSMDPSHPNALAPKKRPYQTIIPGMITRESDGSLYCPFGVMGGFMQPQGHVQVVLGLIDDALEPQAVLDRPRFFLSPAVPAGIVRMEEGIPEKVAEELRALGHTVKSNESGYDRFEFGRGQIIRSMDDGVLWAGSDPRSDGCAMGF